MMRWFEPPRSYPLFAAVGLMVGTMVRFLIGFLG